ncbi:uncharacterized protein LOC144110392 isoform X3 [Amblyomma americanum]
MGQSKQDECQRGLRLRLITPLCRREALETMNAFACTPCGKTFSGRDPYRQHLESEKHKKKIQSASIFQACLKCEACQMTFTGPIPLEAHLASAGHAKAMAKKQPLSGLEALTSGMKTIALATPQPSTAQSGFLQCDICKIPSFPCSKDAFDHYESAEHRQRKKASQLGVEPSMYRPLGNSQPSAVTQKQLPTLPSSLLLCKAEESFGDFCKKNNIFFAC